MKPARKTRFQIESRRFTGSLRISAVDGLHARARARSARESMRTKAEAQRHRDQNDARSTDRRARGARWHVTLEGTRALSPRSVLVLDPEAPGPPRPEDQDPGIERPARARIPTHAPPHRAL